MYMNKLRHGKRTDQKLVGFDRWDGSLSNPGFVQVRANPVLPRQGEPVGVAADLRNDVLLGIHAGLQNLSVHLHFRVTSCTKFCSSSCSL